MDAGEKLKSARFVDSGGVVYDVGGECQQRGEGYIVDCVGVR